MFTMTEMRNQRGQLLRAALGFAGLPRPSYDRSLWALRTWLDSWAGIGHVAVRPHRTLTRLVVVPAFALFVVTGCTTASKPMGRAEPARVARRQHEVIVVVSDRTLYFENVRPPCAHWSVPGRWTFAQQPAALRSADGRDFIGVVLYPEQQFNDLPGPELVTRAAEYLRREDERAHKEPIITVVEPFDAPRAGAVVLRVTSQVALPPEIVKEHPQLAGQRVRLPSRVLLPFSPDWLVIISVGRDNLEGAREVIATLRTADHPQCWLPLLRQQFPDVRW